jgi:hypothetical protein
MRIDRIHLNNFKLFEDFEMNFLLGCVNCNSTKGKKDVVLANFLLPDRDNTAFAYTYREDGEIEVSNALFDSQAALAKSTLELVGLDKSISEVADENGPPFSETRRGSR